MMVTNRSYNSHAENSTETKSVLVECDGHDFHERTKDQAKHDRMKDRFLQANGYNILRFTGSELWSDPYKCAKEIYSFLDIGRSPCQK